MSSLLKDTKENKSSIENIKKKNFILMQILINYKFYLTIIEELQFMSGFIKNQVKNM